jgi:phosphoribosylamine--glycine ligase
MIHSSSIPQLNKVLVIGINPANTKMVEVMAKANPSVQFDYATAFEITNINLPNVNLIYMDLYYNTQSTLITKENSNSIVETANKTAFVGFFFWLQNFLNSNIENYDFVIATYIHLQLADWFQKFKIRRPIFCPDMASARLEDDKLFTKQILSDIGVLTPKFSVLEMDSVIEELGKKSFPLVVKTNAMAGPLGTWVFNDDSYKIEIPRLISKLDNINKIVPTSPKSIYTEEFIKGPEISAHFLCNGTSWKYLGSARDYKKNFDNDTGPNTNGTGCYSPVNYFTEDIKEKVFSYMDKILAYLNNMAVYYKGFMYLGIILDSENNPYLLEINTRPGTPEILTILDTVDNSNLLENLYRAATGQELLDIASKDVHSVAIGLMITEFPVPVGGSRLFSSNKPNVINLPQELTFYEHCSIFIGQTCSGFITNTAPSREEASNNIYKYLNTVEMNDFRYRTDIGFLK